MAKSKQVGMSLSGERRFTKTNKQPFYIVGTDKKGTVIQFENGAKKKVKLLNVNGACAEYAQQLKNNKDKHGNELTERKKAWRAGYLQHAVDSSKSYCAKNKIPSKSKNTSRMPTIWF